MAKLFARIVLWFAGTALAACGAYFALNWLESRHSPGEAVATAFLNRRLGTMTGEQRNLVRQAIQYDAIEAMLVVADSQTHNVAAWDALRRKSLENPSPTLRTQQQALEMSLAAHLDKNDAVQFVDSTLGFWSMLSQVSSNDASKFLDESRRLSPEECRLAARSPSFAFVVGQLEPALRADYRDNEGVLTPVLAAVPMAEWNHIVEMFHRAKPRVVEILKDPHFGRTFGIAYMIYFDDVEKLKSAGADEPSAIEFSAANGATIADLQKKGHSEWPALAARLQSIHGADGKPVFATACADPAVFWLVANDPTDSRRGSIDILCRYAGTQLPAILLKYGRTPTLLAAAIEALNTFDNQRDSDPKKQGSAAHFLSKYQDDDAFKESLEKDGAVLIPALSAGGPDALADIHKNPNDIYKWVDKEGQPRKTPLWTYIPGGNIAYAIHEKWKGRTLTWGEITWAAIDTVLLVPIIDGPVLLGRAAAEAGGKSLLEAAAEAGEKGGMEIIVEDTGENVVTAAAKAGTGMAEAATARSMLKAAGFAVADGLGNSIKFAAEMGKAHPWRALALSAAILAAAFPERTRQLANNLAHVTGELAMEAPGSVIEGMWDELQRLVAQRPMIAWVFYLIFAAVLVTPVLVAILLLRVFLPPAYFAVARPLGWLAKKLASAARPAGRGLQR